MHSALRGSQTADRHLGFPRSADPRTRSGARLRADARGVQRRFKFILVDEFQDTDPVQAELLTLLAGDGTGRVRNGALFWSAIRSSRSTASAAPTSECISASTTKLLNHGARPVVLKQSFRSVPNIQRFVTAAFRDPMRRDDDALQPGYVELNQCRNKCRAALGRRAAGAASLRPISRREEEHRGVAARRHRRVRPLADRRAAGA